MALVYNCDPDLRIYSPSFAREYPLLQEQSECRSRLLAKIHNSYCKSLERLSLRVRPGMAARFLDGGGFCLGSSTRYPTSWPTPSSPSGALCTSRASVSSFTSPRKSSRTWSAGRWTAW
uniref:Uncharacterized protein n=1 Tax=Arundo donax TaxID=35708 RepID=A0A0A8YLD0_ARUDO